jgi:hypothetical protein
MNAVILCPGPSLAKLERLPDHDLSLAVNGAALRWMVDVWAAIDWPLIRSIGRDVLGFPDLLTTAASLASLERHDIRWRGNTIVCDSLRNLVPTEIGWSNFTAPTAVVYAFRRGAHRIDVYGCDMAGTEDFDGKARGENRSEQRWGMERQIWRRLVEWMAGMEIEVTIHGTSR